MNIPHVPLAKEKESISVSLNNVNKDTMSKPQRALGATAGTKQPRSASDTVREEVAILQDSMAQGDRKVEPLDTPERPEK